MHQLPAEAMTQATRRKMGEIADWLPCVVLSRGKYIAVWQSRHYPLMNVTQMCNSLDEAVAVARAFNQLLP